MPRGDRTGPDGRGPMTGRARGYCAGYEQPGQMTPIPGRDFWGWGGCGGGRGWRNWYYATGLPGWQRTPMGPFCPYCGPCAAPYVPVSEGPFCPYCGAAYGPSPMTQVQERDTLKAEVESLEEVLENLRKRLQELEAKTKEE